MQRLTKLVILLIGITILLVTVGCPPPPRGVIKDRPVYEPAPSKPGPPPWAPAHGHRAKHRYYYYPASCVYFDIGRSVYFYYRNGAWQVSASLPTAIYIDVKEHVILDMDTDKPYQFHSDVVKSYPPGQSKQPEKGKGKEKWK